MVNRRYVVLVHWGGELSRISVFGTWQSWELAKKRADAWMKQARKAFADADSAPIAWVVELRSKRTSLFRNLMDRFCS